MRPSLRLTHLLLVPLALIALAIAVAPACAALTYTRLAPLPDPVQFSAMDLGDYDNDGLLDLAVCGYDTTGNFITRIFRNSGNGTTWTDIHAALVNVERGTVRWGDYDGDGRLDLLVSGHTATGYSTVLYHNTPGGFFDSGITLPAGGYPRAEWADLDNDGDLDLVMMTGSGLNASLAIYRNDGGSFSLMQSLPGLGVGSISVADMDGDGRLDIAVEGGNATIVYRNTGGSFSALPLGLPGLSEGAVAWGDYDGDGLPDLAITGIHANAGMGRIYHNDGGGSFSSIATQPAQLVWSALAWADVEGDGDLDLGQMGSNPDAGLDTTGVWRDTGGAFAYSSLGLPACTYGSFLFGDMTGDGTPDVALSGYSYVLGKTVTALYAAGGAAANAAPGTPMGLTSSVAPGTSPGTALVTFRWTRPTDDHTPRAGITYELRVGGTPGSCEVTGTRFDPTTGVRRVARFGSQGSDTTWTLTIPVAAVPVTYYWSVQAVDGALVGGVPAAEQTFVVSPFMDSGIALTGVRGGLVRGALSWGDVDSDGRPDLVVAGSTTGATSGATSLLYHNGGGTFTPVASGLPAVANPAMAWGDYDRDGRLDLALLGVDPSGLIRILSIERNVGGTFSDANAGLTGVANGGIALSDMDQDGDLDLVACGSTNSVASGGTLTVYGNTNGTYTPIAALKGLTASAVAVGDLDGDGLPDIVATGLDSVGTPTAVVYHNSGNGTFIRVPTTLPGLGGAAVALADYDGDGALDVAISGATTNAAATGITQIFHNDGHAAFTLIASLTGTWRGALAWGDVNGDGRPDLVYCGQSPSGVRYTKVGINGGAGTFTDTDLGLPGVGESGLALADYDGDGRLDVALCGFNGSTAITRIYRNIGPAVNTPPTAPTGLTSSTVAGRTVLRWARSTDAQTPSALLTYDVRIGTSIQSGQIVSLPADSLTGARRVARFGTCDADSFVILNLPDQRLYWTVQAVDASLAGSALPQWQPLTPGTTGVAGGPAGVAAALSIRTVAPNPIVASAKVSFDVPRAGAAELSIFDVSGRRVRTLVSGRLDAGPHAATWDGTSDGGVPLPAGVYEVSLSSAGHRDVRRIALIR